MCGLAGIISTTAEIPDGAIARMSDRLQHRGPDAQVCVTLPDCHLGHTRLSIIDLAGGSQPMTEETERYWIVFNGEIYNYRELRHDLEKQGWHFRTQSDTEVLLRAYQAYGEKVPTYLNGQFAFAIWDRTERKLFVARDRLGEKPFFWASTPQGHFLFASEIKAILAADLIQAQIDPVSVDAYLGLLYVSPDRTIYRNINSLKPGHALIWNAGSCRQWAYWKPSYSSHRAAIHPQELVEQLQSLIAQAVQRQMVADVPVGAFLSGGLDSSTIVALMCEQTSHSVKTFSAGFGDLINELPYARAVAQAYQTEHHEMQVDIPVSTLLERMVEVYDQPFADSSNIPTYLIAEFARRHVKVVLSGDGGDELFGGYEWYRWLRPSSSEVSTQERTWLRLQALGLRVLAKIGLPLRNLRDRTIQTSKIADYAAYYPDVWERHLAFVTELKSDRAALWQDNSYKESQVSLQQAYRPGDEIEDIDRATDFDLRCYLPGDILVKVDRATMAHGLESRSPFLDVDLVEFVLSLPWQLRFQAETLKPLLRESCHHLWPQAIQHRPKQGFGAPIGNWLQQVEVQKLLQRVTAPNAALLELMPGVRTVLPRMSAQQTWSVLCLGLWLERRSGCLSSPL